MIDKIYRQFKKIEDAKLISVPQIVKMGLIVDTNLKPSLFSLYRIIKNGQLKAINMGNGDAPRYFVKGSDLKKFLVKRYQLKIKE